MLLDDEDLMCEVYVDDDDDNTPLDNVSSNVKLVISFSALSGDTHGGSPTAVQA